MSGILFKICGLTRPEDVLLCHDLGVDLVGFVFAPSSPRFISPRDAAGLPVGRGLRVGVFAGADLEYVREVAELASLDYIQLHGGEDESFCRALGPERVIRVFWPQGLTKLDFKAEMDRFAPVCAYFLFDAGSGGGGGGRTLDFQILTGLESPRPWFLAGGLGPDTLPGALKLCTPDGADCSSRLETAPGVKDHVLIRRMVEIIHNFNLKSHKDNA